MALCPNHVRLTRHDVRTLPGVVVETRYLTALPGIGSLVNPFNQHPATSEESLVPQESTLYRSP
jgi:hypothetical protein